MTLSQRIGVEIISDTFSKYKCLFTYFFPQTIRDWNDLPDSLISSTEMSDDCVSKFTLSRSTQPGTNSAPASTRPVYVLHCLVKKCLELCYCYYMFKSLLEYRKSILDILSYDCDKKSRQQLVLVHLNLYVINLSNALICYSVLIGKKNNNINRPLTK